MLKEDSTFQPEGARYLYDVWEEQARLAALEADSLEREIHVIMEEVRRIGGGRTPSDALRMVSREKWEMNEQIMRLEELVTLLGRRQEELEAEKRAIVNRWIFTGEDLAEEAAEAALPGRYTIRVGGEKHEITIVTGRPERFTALIRK